MICRAFATSRTATATLVFVALSRLAPAQSSDGVRTFATATPIPILGTGSEEVERVGEVVTSPRGAIAIADRASGKVHLLNASRSRTCSAGSRGRGPGEFLDITRMWFVEDALYIYDGVTSRLTRFDGACVALDSKSTPLLDGSPSQVLAVSRGGDLLVATTSFSASQSSGLIAKQHNLASVLQSGSMIRHGSVPAGYVYRVEQSGSVTLYDVTFLSRSYAAAVPRGIVWIGRDSRDVEFRSIQWSSIDRVALPGAGRRFDRAEVRRHRDSLVAAIVSAGESRFPGARNRIEHAFGENFPAVEFSAAVSSIVAGGHLVYVRLAQGPAARQEWIVIDSRTSRILGRLGLPSTIRVAGATDSSLFAVTLDSDELEHLVEIPIPELATRRP
jgi:hypothetical protein